MEDTPLVTPGEEVGSVEQYEAGDGVHVLDNCIYAAIVGARVIDKPDGDTAVSGQPSGKPRLSVVGLKPLSIVPQPGDSVMARVIRINPRYATCLLLSISSHPLPHPLPGLIRQTAIRAFDIDNCAVVNCYRPGDIVRATVLSLGDARNYYLSTTREDEGVVEGTSAAGGALRAVSWERMECSITGMKEPRKVAKPRNLTSSTNTTAQPPP